MLWVAVWATAMIVSMQASADTVIGVNFCDGWETPHLAGKTADGFSNWTDSWPIEGEIKTNARNGTGLVVLGSNSLVTCDWSSPNTYAGGQEGTSEQQLYRVYLDDGGSGCLVTITGLNAWLADAGLGAYTIRIYHSTDNNNVRFLPVDIKAGDTILQTVQETNMWTTDGGSRAYVDSGILTADTITLDPYPRTGTPRGTIAGFKITGVNKFLALNPDPAVGAEVQLTKVLSWQQAAAANGLGVTYNVYFGEDANSLSPTYYGLTPKKTTTTEPADFNYDPDLANSKTYYWRVDALEPNVPNAVAHAGDEWWFTTVPPNAYVTLDPVSQTVPMGSTVQLTVAGENIDSYQWFKDNVLMDGETAATLTIENAQVADEGYYHCQVDNSLIQPDASAAAQVMTKRLVGWWKLDGNLTDSVDQVVAGAPTHDGSAIYPIFEPVAKDGGGIAFDGEPNAVVIIADSIDFFNFYPQGLTASVWIKTAHNGWDGYLSKHGGGSGWTLDLYNDNQDTHFTVRGSHGDLWGSDDDGSLYDENWHLVTAVIDRTTQTSRIYVDGLLRGTSGTYATPARTATALIFGAEGDNGSHLINNTVIDDVRIWSYPLDAQTIANLYTDFNPGVWVCLDRPALDTTGPDGVPDCKVDIYELAQVARAWLECGRSPSGYCFE